MKMRLLRMVKSVLFVLLGVVVFLKAQDVLTPNWDETGNKIAAIENGTVPTFDVLFLGTSHVRCGVSPMELYMNYGIRSYNLGTDGQPMEGSYFLLEQAYRAYDIETVLLDVSAMFMDESNFNGAALNGCWRRILDNLSFGGLKYHMAKVYAQNEWSDGFFSAIFPIIGYHSSWTSLMDENLCPTEGVRYSLGQNIYGGISAAPAHFTIENIDYATEYIHNFHSGKMVKAVNGDVSTKIIEEDLATTSIADINLEYLLRIEALCEKHGSNLVLFKVPTMRPPQWGDNMWTRIKSEMISQIAEQLGLEFWDLQFNTDFVPLSLATDTLDSGIHLNVWGAKRVTDYLGSRISEQHLAFRRTGSDYNKYLEIYQKMLKTITLQTSSNFYEYLRFMKENYADWTVIIAVKDNYTLGFTDEDASALNDFGLNLISRLEFRDLRNSYIGIVSSGKNVYEAVSDYELEHEIELPGGTRAVVVSRNGWMQDPGCSIRINDEEYSQSISGLNIVVYDHETGCVLDTVSSDIYNQKMFVRNQKTSDTLLKTYESALCEKEGW